MATFKKRKGNKPVRKVERNSDNEEEDQGIVSNLSETFLLQKARKRTRGVGTDYLMKKKELKQEEKSDKPKVQYGLYDPTKSRPEDMEESIKSALTSFTQQTDRTVLDSRMERYVEEQLRKKKGIEKEVKKVAKKSEHDLLYAIPDHLKVPVLPSSRPATEEEEQTNVAISLSSVEAVPLPNEFKQKNIDATEKAKEKISEQKSVNMDSVLIDVVNFGRYSAQSDLQNMRNSEKSTIATDDAVFERYKKRFGESSKNRRHDVVGFY